MIYATNDPGNKTIRKGDRHWLINNGLTVTPRAGLEIKQECPTEYKDIIAICVSKGWLEPVATMRNDEHMWEELRK